MPDTDKRTFDLKKLLPGTYFCQGCAERVCAGVGQLAGVREATCDLDAGVLDVSYEPNTLSARQLESAVQRIVLEETDRVGHATYRLTGLD